MGELTNYVNVCIVTNDNFLYQGFKFLLSDMEKTFNQYKYRLERIVIGCKDVSLSFYDIIICDNIMNNLYFRDFKNTNSIVVNHNYSIDSYIKIFNKKTHPENDDLEQLSLTEKRMLKLISQGKSDRKISASMSISTKKVSCIRISILKKLRINNRHKLYLMLMTGYGMQ